MSGRSSMTEAAMARLLGRLPDPDISPGLARRIVAETAELPQHQPRAAVIAVVPVSARPLGQVAVGQRAAGFLTFAAVACLLVVLWPAGVRHPADRAVLPRTAVIRPAGAMPNSVGQVEKPVLALARPAVAHVGKAPHPEAQVERAAVAEGVPLPQGAGEAPAVPVPPAPVEMADARQPAPAAGPKASIQGPPVPPDLAPAGRSTPGLGLAGGAGSSAIPRQR